MTIRKRVLTRPIALVGLSLLAAACVAAPARRPAPAEIGAASPRDAIRLYFGAVSSRDYPAVARIWGGKTEMARQRFSSDEFQERVIITACYIGWKHYRIESQSPGLDDALDFMVRSADVAHPEDVRVHVVQRPNGRWVVESADIGHMRPRAC